jgi:hypothetical protein
MEASHWLVTDCAFTQWKDPATSSGSAAKADIQSRIVTARGICGPVRPEDKGRELLHAECRILSDQRPFSKGLPIDRWVSLAMELSFEIASPLTLLKADQVTTFSTKTVLDCERRRNTFWYIWGLEACKGSIILNSRRHTMDANRQAVYNVERSDPVPL